MKRILTATMVLVGVLATTARAQTTPDAPPNVFPGKVSTLKLQIPPDIMARYLRNKVIAPKRPMSTQPIVLSVPMDELTNIHPLGNKGLPDKGCQCNPGELVIEQNPADKPPGATPNEKAAWQLVRAMGRVEVCQPKDPILNPADNLPAWIQTSNMMSSVDGVGGTGCVKLSAVLKVLKIDTDSDGIFDGEDKCPTLPKGDHPDPKRIGCPDKDTDSDGIFDTQDLCPTVHAGSTPDPARLGCPAGDRDHDLIVDHLDACPDVPGVADPDPKKNGCPVLVLAATPAPLVTPPAVSSSPVLLGVGRIYFGPAALYSSYLPRGGGICGMVGGSYVFTNGKTHDSRHGLGINVLGCWHPEMIGQGEVAALRALSFRINPYYLWAFSHRAALLVGVSLLSTTIIGENARRGLAGLANLGVQIGGNTKSTQKGGVYGLVQLGLGGGENCDYGYPCQARANFEAVLSVGYAARINRYRSASSN